MPAYLYTLIREPLCLPQHCRTAAYLGGEAYVIGLQVPVNHHLARNSLLMQVAQSRR